MIVVILYQARGHLSIAILCSELYPMSQARGRDARDHQVIISQNLLVVPGFDLSLGGLA